MIVWSIIIAVALYPIFDWLSAKLYGHRALAAIAITILSLLVMLGPATWLALSLAETVWILLARLGDGTLTFPPPSEAVKAWPLIGERSTRAGCLLRPTFGRSSLRRHHILNPSAALAASAAGLLAGMAITATRRRTRSAISDGRRSYWPSSQWYSTFRSGLR
jgi:hypothetical protein